MNQACSKYMGKVIYTLFVLMLLESMCSFIFLFPAIRIFSSGGQAGLSFTPLAKAALFLILFAVLVVWLTFQFGFAVMLLRMARNEKVNLGFLFMGFRKFNPAGKVILSFAAIISALGIVSRFMTKAVFARLWPVFSAGLKEIGEAEGAAAAGGADVASSSGAAGQLFSLSSEDAASVLFESGLFAGIFFLLVIIVLIHFVFVFQLHFDKPSEKTRDLFKESYNMMRGNVFRLIGFALRAGGKNLVIAVAFALLVSFIPQDIAGLSVLVFVFDLIYFINLYTALVKFYFTVPLMYEQIRSGDTESEIKEIAANDGGKKL